MGSDVIRFNDREWDERFHAAIQKENDVSYCWPFNQGNQRLGISSHAEVLSDVRNVLNILYIL